MNGEWLVRWSVRGAMLFYAVFLWSWLGRPAKPQALRWWWTIGCLLMIVHFVAAFQFIHHWSHQHAWLDTAQRTGDLIGWEFGGGIFFNYGFLAIWMLDVTWWWAQPQSYIRRIRWLSTAIHAYILFVAINGCIVFEPGPTRWFSIAICVALLVRMVRFRSWRSKASL